MEPSLPRRALLKGGATMLGIMGATIGVAGAQPRPPVSAPAAQATLPIIDTHHHIWDLSRFRRRWSEPGSPLHRNFLMDDYVDAVAGLVVVRTIYVEVMVDPAQQLAEAEYVLDLCQRGQTLMAGFVIGGDPASRGFAAYVTRFKGSRYLKGVRHSIRRALDRPLDDALVGGLRLLGDLGLSFDLLLGPRQLPAAARLVDACSGTRFVLDHCGSPDMRWPDQSRWEHGITELAARPQVVCKISGIVSSARPEWTPADLRPFVRHVLEAFGPDRVMFGSDWPRCTLRATVRQWVDALRWIARRERADERRLFHDNAAAFYGLS